MRSGRACRLAWLVLGLACVALGAVGAVLPLLPTTPFLILAAASFARSSPRLEAWLLAHPTSGPLLTQWRRNGAIAPRIKAAACTGILLGYASFFLGAQPGWPMAAGVAMLMLAAAAYVLSRPSAAPPVQGGSPTRGKENGAGRNQRHRTAARQPEP